MFKSTTLRCELKSCMMNDFLTDSSDAADVQPSDDPILSDNE